MIANVTGLTQKARQVYSEEGLRTLLIKIPSYINRRLWGELFLKKRYLSTDEVEKTAEEEGHIWHFEREPPFQVDPPSHTELKESFERGTRKSSPKRPFVCELRNCTLLGPYAVGLTENREIIGETIPVSLDRFHLAPSIYYRAPKRYLSSRTVEAVIRPEPEQRLDCAFPLSCPDPSYFHWILEYLPKIRFMERYMKETDRVPKIVVGPEPSQYVSETLDVLGYGPNGYVEAGQGVTFAERLVVSAHRTHLFDNFSKEDIMWLRRRIRSEVDVDKESGEDRRVYISRQKSNRGRMVVNYDELMSLLQKRGFESYLLEDMSFRKQVELFMQPDVIMGPHGAGLVNMIFADDPKVIELHPSDDIRPYFYFLSEFLDFDYEPLVTNNQDKNLIVDTHALRQHLDSVGI